VPTEADGRVIAFIEKPPLGEAPTNLINAGIYVLETSVLDRIPGGRRASIERETFPELVGARTLYAFASDAYWLDTGTAQQFLQAQLDILSGRRQVLPAGPQVLTGVWVDPSAEVGGRLLPCCFVGPGVSIAVGAEVSQCVLGAGSTVGPDAVLSRSVLMSGAEVRSGAVVSDTIVGPRAVIGEGAHLSGMTIIGVGAEVPEGSVLDAARYPSS
jgi:NDP-sugar pyrophosphorylase family protein